MITRTAVRWHTEDWQQALRHTINSVDELWQRLELPLDALPGARAAAGDFPLRVPAGFVARMEKGNLADPLLQQVLPTGDELDVPAGFVSDPLVERHSNPVQGMLHKYASRVLVIAGSACAINCRYCFRRHFPYEDNGLSREQFGQVLDYVQAHPEVNEVIFSGGDPLVTSNARLRQWLAALAELPQLKRVRFHTRTPVVIPQRIDASLLEMLTATPLQKIMVVHVNHANETGADFNAAMQALTQAGVTLLNQSVLLRGVNDDAGVLAQLSESLFASGILPYYLHLLDPVAGAQRFQVDDARAMQIYRELSALLPGYLLPKLVREIPGVPAKQPLAPELRADALTQP